MEHQPRDLENPQHSSSTPDGNMKVKTGGPENTTLLVKPGRKFLEMIDRVHRILLEREQGVVKPTPKEPDET